MMNIQNEIDKFAKEEDKPILHWLFRKYHMASQWYFVANCSWKRYGKLSYEANRVWYPSEEGKILYEHMIQLTEPKKETHITRYESIYDYDEE